MRWPEWFLDLLSILLGLLAIVVVCIGTAVFIAIALTIALGPAS